MNSGSLTRIVSIGGGTGLACLLKGLKNAVLDSSLIEAPQRDPWISRLTAVVTVTDDGGSSGRLREELQVLPPGDIRNCMVALSADESLLSKLFQHRFSGSGPLGGHSFGNLFLSALTGITGDFLTAVRVSSDVLATRGRIYPSTPDDVHLEAVLEDGTTVRGESAISNSTQRIERVELSAPRCRPVPEVLDAIRAADIITVGPGSLFTSILPNLLVRGITRAIRRSAAVKIFIGNLMTQPGETDGLSAADHVSTIYRHTGPGLFDGIILSNAPIPRVQLARYGRQGSLPVARDHTRLRGLGLRIHEERLLARGSVVRHDPTQLALAVRSACSAWRTVRADFKLRRFAAPKTAAQLR